jgi:hypothetical protein
MDMCQEGESELWVDPATGLMWARQDNRSDLSWKQAISYSQNLRLAGYSDWRLPTIEELESLYDPTVDVPGIMTDGSVARMHVKGGLQLSGWQWSSTVDVAPGWTPAPEWAWTLIFLSGDRRSMRFSARLLGRALCVRNC